MSTEPDPISPPALTKKERNLANQRRFRERHKHEMKEIRARYDENMWRRKLGLEVKP